MVSLQQLPTLDPFSKTSSLVTRSVSTVASANDTILTLGTCLTVTEYDGTTSFKVGMAPETLRRTNLGELKVGSKVNLERAVAGHTRFGGHFVQVFFRVGRTEIDLGPCRYNSRDSIKAP